MRLKIRDVLIVMISCLIFGLVLAFAIDHLTTDHDAIETWEQETEIPKLEFTPPPLFNENLVQHPLTGEWITREQAEREAKIIEAILCSQGNEAYC